MDRNNIETVYSENKNYLAFSEMPAFLTELASKTEDEDIKDKLIQCSVALELYLMICFQ